MSTLSVQQAFQVALQHHQAGRLADAEALYRQILSVQPQHDEALHLLGVIAHQLGQHQMAAEWIGGSIQINPNNAAAYSNLGQIYQSLGRLDEAVDVYRRALALAPGYSQARLNLGNALKDLGRFDEAIAEYQSAIHFQPDYVGASINLGNTLQICGRFAEAASTYQAALQIDPSNAELVYNLGIVLKSLGRLDDAVVAFEGAMQRRPDFPEAGVHLANVLKDQGRIEAAVAIYEWTMESERATPAMHSNLIQALAYLPSADDSRIAAEQQRWNSCVADSFTPRSTAWPNPRDPKRRLRIGYVSPDFRSHVVGQNVWPLFRCHDHRAFEVVCYSDAAAPDAMTQEFRARSDQWHDTAAMPDESLADLIRGDGIDILIDLAQHTAGNRLPVFARQFAPLQVSFAGYPATTGVEAIRYRLSDRWLEEGVDAARSEKERVFLLESFWCYEPGCTSADVGALPARDDGTITFGSLNHFCKVNEPLLRLWGRVLREVKDARLVLLTPEGSHRQRVRALLEREGIVGQRVGFAEPRPREAYLELYREIDIVLDTFPYNGHTTSLDALWMGVPVASLAGRRTVSRAGLSQLTNLGLPELVARTEDEYVDIATKLAGDLPRLAELRATLRARMEASVLMDAPRFARQIEAAYRTMWRDWCTENPSP